MAPQLQEELAKLYSRGNAAVAVAEDDGDRPNIWVPPPRPAALIDLSVAALYRYYAENCVDAQIVDPRGIRVRFQENHFAYLTKLEFHDLNLDAWVSAKASIAVRQLKDGTFDETRYRVGDKSRARTLPYLRGIIEDPDCIHDNFKQGMSDKEIYVKRYQPVSADDEGIKVVLAAKGRNRTRQFASSFFTRQNWLEKASKIPAHYIRINDKGCRCR